MRTISVAVAGLGFVGRETVRLLESSRERFRRRLGADVKLAAVADRDVRREARALRLPKSVALESDPQRLLARRPDILVELLGGLPAPMALVVSALRSGIHVVTANKRLLAARWDQIHAAAAAGSARLYFEGSVAGGIPVISALDTGFSANRIEAVYGILNGTTNYVLSRAEEGVSPAEALKEAQALGLAEKDPTMDLSGQDTAQKISVLCALLTGRALSPGEIDAQGITGIEASDISFARAQLGCAVRLLGALRLSWGRSPLVEAHVQPTLVPLDHPLAAVRREYNAVLVKASAAGDLMFYGKGAGPGPTASAVAGDVFMLARDILGELPARRPPATGVRAAPRDAAVSRFYLKVFAQDKPGVLAKVTAALGRAGVSISTIHQPGKPEASGMPIVLTTHPARHGAFAGALARILALSAVARRHTVMRMLS